VKDVKVHKKLIIFFAILQASTRWVFKQENHSKMLSPLPCPFLQIFTIICVD
jgi:hypothetical protein